MIDYAAVLAVIRPNAEWGCAKTYQDVVDTWRDQVQSVPTEQEFTDAWSAVESDIAAIADYPTADEINGVAVGSITGTSADAVKARYDAAIAARANLP